MLMSYSVIVIYATSMDFRYNFHSAFAKDLLSVFFSNIGVIIFALGKWETSP